MGKKIKWVTKINSLTIEATKKHPLGCFFVAKKVYKPSVAISVNAFFISSSVGGLGMSHSTASV